MIDIAQELAIAIEAACRTLIPDHSDQASLLKACSTPPTACHDPRFGDYQSNVAMSLGKNLGKKPRELADQIIGQLKLEHLCSKIEPAGPGFINFHLKTEVVAQQLDAMRTDPHDGIAQVKNKAKVVIDFSSPNIAKSMHVGHIRSTFLGDALARISRATGYQVVTDNHLGDWGTQFGKLIYGYKNFLNQQALAESPIAEFERLYKEANTLSENDPNVLQSVRQELAKLQAGDPENLKIWKEISEHSLTEFKKAYDRMGVQFDHQLGESL
jgi:arginyl-tRNA synthetase